VTSKSSFSIIYLSPLFNNVILGLDPRIQTPLPPDWIPAFAGMTCVIVKTTA
jgi:hypothetical protein